MKKEGKISEHGNGMKEVTKEELLTQVKNLLESENITENIRQEAGRILDILRAVPNEANLGVIASVPEPPSESVVATCNKDQRSRDAKMQEINEQLNTVRGQIGKWIADNPLVAKGSLREKQAKKWQKPRIAAVIVMAIAAVAAIVFFILECLKVIPTGDLISGIIGVSDLVFGIGVSIYEICDDGKTEKVCKAVDAVEAAKSDDSNQAFTNALNDLTKQLHKKIDIKKIDIHCMCCSIGSSYTKTETNNF